VLHGAIRTIKTYLAIGHNLNYIDQNNDLSYSYNGGFAPVQSAPSLSDEKL